MADVVFADGFDAPEEIAFGLPAPQLGAVASGIALSYVIGHAPIPLVLRAPAIACVVAIAATLGWGRAAGRPLLDWALLGVRFALSPRGGSMLLATGDDPAPPHPDGVHDAGDVQSGASLPPPRPSPRVPPPATPPPADDEPAWARWLRDPRQTTQPPTVDDRVEAPPAAVDHPAEGEEPAEEGQALTVADAIAAPAASPARDASTGRRPGHALPRPLAGPDPRRATSPAEVEIQRTPLVLLPTPVARSGHPPEDGEEDGVGQEADDLPEGELELSDDMAAIVPITSRRSWPDQDTPTPVAVIPDTGQSPVQDRGERATPVFVGATRRLTFFSLNGGAGRTTLATELACLLAAKGRHRTALGESQRLRVALLDLDLRSSTVAVHLGIPQPTVWDYLLAGSEDPGPITDYMVSHASGLRALLGPPKPLNATGTALEPARVAEIVDELERDGTHFIIIDISGDLNAVTAWVLGAVHDIYVVLTPTASGIQDAYRTTESLRRLGLAAKLRYIVNRSRGGVDFSETMTDLGGTIVATIPYDQAVVEAENEHRVTALDKPGPAATAMHEFATHIFPGLQVPRRPRGIGRFLRWRRAG